MGGVELPVLMESLFCVTELQRVVSMWEVVMVGVTIAGYCQMEGERKAGEREREGEREKEKERYIDVHEYVAGPTNATITSKQNEYAHRQETVESCHEGQPTYASLTQSPTAG